MLTKKQLVVAHIKGFKHQTISPSGCLIGEDIQACPTGRKLRGRWRTCWRDYPSQLDREWLRNFSLLYFIYWDFKLQYCKDWFLNNTFYSSSESTLYSVHHSPIHTMNTSESDLEFSILLKDSKACRLETGAERLNHQPLISGLPVLPRELQPPLVELKYRYRWIGNCGTYWI